MGQWLGLYSTHKTEGLKVTRRVVHLLGSILLLHEQQLQQHEQHFHRVITVCLIVLFIHYSNDNNLTKIILKSESYFKNIETS